jgi:hypothetical protein
MAVQAVNQSLRVKRKEKKVVKFSFERFERHAKQNEVDGTWMVGLLRCPTFEVV